MQRNVHALRPLPGAKADWEILVALARQLGQRWNYGSPQEILWEIAATNPLYAGLSWDELGAQGVRLSARDSELVSEVERAMQEGKTHA